MCDSVTDLNKMLPFFASSFVFNFYSSDVPFAVVVVVVLLRKEKRIEQQKGRRGEGQKGH